MFNERMKKLGEERSAIRELFEYGARRKQEIGAENVFDFSIGNPSVPAPDCVNEGIKRLLREVPAETLHGYSSAAGLYEARKGISDYIRTAFGSPMEPELVYLTCGAAASLTVALGGILEAGDEVIVVAPFFPEYRVFVETAGGVCVPVPADARFHLDLEAIARAITEKTRAVIVNSPNNPTGAVYGEAEIEGLARLLREKSVGRDPVLLLSDEPYRELVYGEKPPYVPNFYADTVVCYSYSKSLSLAGERIGYVAVSPRCARAKELFFAIAGAGRAYGYVCAPVLFQRIAAACAGKSSDVSRYRENRDLLFGALAKFGYVCTAPEGAFYLFVESPEPDAKAFCERAKKYELLIVPSDSFGITGYARVSYCVARETIERSLPAFEKLIAEYRRNS